MQSDLILPSVPGPDVRDYLNWFAEAIVTQQSGPDEPPNPKPFQFWADTANGLLNIRNAGNSAWVTVGTLDTPNLGLATRGANTFTGAQDYARNVLQRPRLRDYGETVNDVEIIRAGKVTDFDLRLGNVAIHSFGVGFTIATLSDPTPITFSNPPPTGTAGTLTLRLRNVGLLNLVWPASVKWPGGVAPKLTANGPGFDVLTFMTVDGGATWFGFTAGLDMK